jgi:hypothetical protein
MEPPNDELLRSEQRKREAHWDPAERWRVIQEMIAWADAQATVCRNTSARCLELQRAKDRGAVAVASDALLRAVEKKSPLPPGEGWGEGERRAGLRGA